MKASSSGDLTTILFLFFVKERMATTKNRLSDIERWLSSSPAADTWSENASRHAPIPTTTGPSPTTRAPVRGGGRRVLRIAVLAATVMMAGFVVAACMRRAGTTLPIPAQARDVWQTITGRVAPKLSPPASERPRAALPRDEPPHAAVDATEVDATEVVDEADVTEEEMVVGASEEDLPEELDEDDDPQFTPL
jgi:hypothetical protein